MVIKVLNLNKCIEDFEKAKNINLYPVIKTATQLVQNTAKDLAPKDTGRLFRSIHRKVYDKGINSYGRVFTNVEYASYQEFGYSRVIKKGESLFGGKVLAKKNINVVYAGKPFMRPALERHKELIQKGVKDYIKTYLRSLGK